LALGEACNLDDQCGSDLCASTRGRGLVCAEGCDQLYQTCATAKTCRPVRAGSEVIGVCEDDECDNASDCSGAGAVCVAGLCKTACTVDLTRGAYKDDCDNALEHCQPLGAQQALVCTTVGSVAPEGCDVLLDPCLRGDACIDGRCRTYCGAESNEACACETLGEFSACR
jgi:hypothetical protein